MTLNAKEEIGLGDLEKTLKINALLDIPFDQRDAKWVEEFLSNIASANLKLAQQEVVLANDGFPYILLESIQPQEEFKAFVIDQQLPTILKQGFGIVINGQKERADWVFTYGDITNFELNDDFYFDNGLFSRNRETITLREDEEILTGQPSDAILPKYLRRQLKEYLTHTGIREPKIMLIARNYEDDANATQDLIFNFTPEQFKSEKEFNDTMRTISWFMPRHYSFFTIDERAFENGFAPL